MDFQQIIAGTVGRENTYGTCEGLVKASPMSFARFSTNDLEGTIDGYVGEGEFTDDPLTTFGGAGVVRSPISRPCCASSAKTVSSITSPPTCPPCAAVQEATGHYLGWNVAYHE